MWRRLKRRAWKTPPGRRLASVSLQLNNSPPRAAVTLRSSRQESAEKSLRTRGSSLAAIFIQGTPFPALCIDVLPETMPTSFRDPTSHIWVLTHMETVAYCPFQLQWVRGLEDLEISKSTQGRKVGQTHLLKSRPYVPREKTY